MEGGLQGFQIGDISGEILNLPVKSRGVPMIFMEPIEPPDRQEKKTRERKVQMTGMVTLG
jgi:hypothetical protein